MRKGREGGDGVIGRSMRTIVRRGWTCGSWSGSKVASRQPGSTTSRNDDRCSEIGEGSIVVHGIVVASMIAGHDYVNRRIASKHGEEHQVAVIRRGASVSRSTIWQR